MASGPAGQSTPPSGVRRRLGIRGRTTIGASLVVALALVVGAIAFVQILTATVHDTVGAAAEVRLEELADRIDGGRGGPGGNPAVTDLDDDLVQILDRDGRVLVSSEEAADAASDSSPALIEWSDSDDRGRDAGPTPVTIGDEPYMVVSEELDDDRVLVLAVSIEDQLGTVSTVTVLLMIGVPLVIVLVALVTWLVVGRALAPVSRIRGEVQQITADRLDRRVPVPATGDEIAALAATMNGMLDRLDAAARAQRRFVSDASHELRSPLATIRQHAELAIAYPDATTEAELAEVVHAEGLRLQGLVDSLLLLARLDEGAEHRFVSVDLDDILLAEVSRLRAFGIEVDAARIRPGRVQGDPRLLAQLVRNLADNAARHARGRIALAIEPTAVTVTVIVDDDGAGIAPSERERVFDRFVRLDDARARDAGGSGLGLAIVREIARAEGGDVTVSDSPWGGARFRVTLPAST